MYINKMCNNSFYTKSWIALSHASDKDMEIGGAVKR